MAILPYHISFQNIQAQKKRILQPEVLYGNPDLIKMCIKSMPYKWKYTSGVLSFAPEDAPTQNKLNTVIDTFEKMAFPGLEGNSYSILWVQHRHLSRVELHFIIPRQELQSGRSFNPFPSGWQKIFHPFEKWCNVFYGWAQPDAPCRPARAVRPGLDALKYASDMSNQDKIYFKKVLSAYMLDLCMQRKIMRRDDIICLLKNFGYTIPRLGKDYITVKAPGSGQRIRLTGDVFEENFYTVDFSNKVKIKYSHV